MQKILDTRRCGILLHPTSFPSPYAIGDLGLEARQTLKTLASAGVTLWQILPLGPTGFGDSPYAARSTFAGNEFLIDPRQLQPLFGASFPASPNLTTGRVDYNYVTAHKMPLLRQAATLFLSTHQQDQNFQDFCASNSWWLDDYALYQSLVHYFHDSRWFTWESDIKTRKKASITHWTNKLKSEIEIYKALQYFFFSQWNDLHAYASELGIKIIGDLPIYVASDSVDAWTNWELFKIDQDGNQTAQAGCPPDAFSADGQLWGNPVYNWPNHAKDGYAWWNKRMSMTLKMVDIVRIDHMRGFESYWEVPAGEKTAVSGKWVPGPNMDLLKSFKKFNIIGEDLGFLTPAVHKMQKQSGFPGMKVLQFAWDILPDGNLDTTNAYLPFNYTPNSVAYTGTHDNQTSRGWYNSLSPAVQDIVRRYFQCADSDVVWQMIRSILSSVANTAIIPMQDLLGLDDSARMNTPSTVGISNWSWRYDSNLLQPWMLERLSNMIHLYGRFPTP